MEIREHLVFPNFVYTVNFDIDNSILKNYIFELEKKSVGRLCSNAGGWQGDITSSSNFKINDLVERCRSVCTEVSGYWKLAKNVRVKNIWANINRNNNFNYPHFHPKSTFSGVYYVDAFAGTGNLVLKRPDIQEHYIDELDSEYTQKTFSITPESGMFVLFPSYLNHYVEQNTSNNVRVSIAMNFEGI